MSELHWKNKYEELIEEALSSAQENYGRKTNEFKFEGIIFGGNTPRLIFKEPKKVLVQLTPSTIGSEKMGIFQLSHEAIHLLSPFVEPNTIMLEEGLACLYSIAFTAYKTGDKKYPIQGISAVPKYQKSLDLIKELLTIENDAIRKLRSIEPIIGKINSKTFYQAGLSADKNLISELTSKMEI